MGALHLSDTLITCPEVWLASSDKVAPAWSLNEIALFEVSMIAGREVFPNIFRNIFGTKYEDILNILRRIIII